MINTEGFLRMATEDQKKIFRKFAQEFSELIEKEICLLDLINEKKVSRGVLKTCRETFYSINMEDLKELNEIRHKIAQFIFDSIKDPWLSQLEIVKIQCQMYDEYL
jgi:hypothetical protein